MHGIAKINTTKDATTIMLFLLFIFCALGNLKYEMSFFYHYSYNYNDSSAIHEGGPQVADNKRVLITQKIRIQQSTR